MFQTGYILNRRADFLWFITLPFLAIAAGLAGQKWLPITAAASVGLWITTPHHFATWIRTFGFRDEWQRWRLPLIVGPVLIFTAIWLGLTWSPLTVAMLVMLWDHQHSLMQQYGFSRIYDFKAGTGSASTARFDLALNWILYFNMFFVSPYWTQIWVMELFSWKVPLNAAVVQGIHWVSWTITIVFLVIYLGHLIRTVRQGHRINPMKLLFLGSSYFMWYFIAWFSTSPLLYMIAHRIMHGVQYDVIVYSYIQRKAGKTKGVRRLMAEIARPGRAYVFILFGLLYALVFAFLVGNELTDFGLGLLNFNIPYDSLPELGIKHVVSFSKYDLFALTMINAVALVHYYYDSFIWKVRDTKVQTGL
ncbi:MAG: hypothetical protein CL681_13645 [Blastopirellula sp.]|nr:hypothetical protein [Blastopirellula sp.]